MQSAEPVELSASSPTRSAQLFKRTVADGAPVTARSCALFRFGEQCNNHCPMCSNTGDAALFYHPTEELLRRAEFLRQSGFRRCVVTGGEATIHPGFWTVVERLQALGMTWDINTHGRSFARTDFARRAVTTGLSRAIVSLHSHRPAVSAAIFGASESAHAETVAGIDRLLQMRVGVMINCVLSRLNLDHVEEYLQVGYARYGRAATFKFVFPSTGGKGGNWSAIAGLRYADVRDVARRLRQFGASRRMRVFFESFPRCVIGDPEAVNLGRSAFGETHYLDDASGDRIYTMRHIEAELSAFGPQCRDCAVARRCGGVSLAYATRYGVEELEPFPAAP